MSRQITHLSLKIRSPSGNHADQQHDGQPVPEFGSILSDDSSPAVQVAERDILQNDSPQRLRKRGKICHRQGTAVHCAKEGIHARLVETNASLQGLHAGHLQVAFRAHPLVTH